MAYCDIATPIEYTETVAKAESERVSAAGAGYRTRVSYESDDPAWDAFLAATPGGDHLQTSLWAQVKAPFGWRAARVVVTRDDRIVGGVQLLIRPLPLLGRLGGGEPNR